MKNKLAVIGVGSAGIVSLCTQLALLDDWEITSIHSPDIPILGIGESTNPKFVGALEYGLDFDPHLDLPSLNGNLKFGTKYIDWRKKEFYEPLLDGTTAIHFDTSSLAKWALPRFKKRWGDKFKTIEGTVTNIEDKDGYALVEVNDITYAFHHIIDCSGTPSPDTISGFTGTSAEFYKPKALLNHCLIHTIKGGSDKPIEYTGHIATPDGWMFTIPLPTRINYGYLFNDTITPLKTATENFSKQINVPVEKLLGVDYSFEPYVIREMTKGHITRNGNAAVFFEPMFANSLFLYDKINRVLVECILNAYPIHLANRDFRSEARMILNTIAFHYLGGSTYSTPFWEYAKNWSKEILNESPQFEQYIKDISKYTKSTIGWSGSFGIKPEASFQAKQMRDISRNLEYELL